MGEDGEERPEEGVEAEVVENLDLEGDAEREERHLRDVIAQVQRGHG